MRTMFSIVFVFLVSTAFADDKLITLDTRPGVLVSIYSMKQKGASATVVLLPGGAGDLKINKGVPSSNNFLVRSREYFIANGFNVMVVGNPTDMSDLDNSFRTSRQHVEDLLKVVEFARKDSGLPVWLIGTSRGSVSAAAAAIAFGSRELAGIVLTSSITGNKGIRGVQAQELEAIRIPVLVVHHEKDSCNSCNPINVSQITKGLSNAPIKKQIMVNGGANPSGDACAAMHWHGFIGMEREAGDIISNWIKKPKA